MSGNRSIHMVWRFECHRKTRNSMYRFRTLSIGHCSIIGVQCVHLKFTTLLAWSLIELFPRISLNIGEKFWSILVFWSLPNQDYWKEHFSRNVWIWSNATKKDLKIIFSAIDFHNTSSNDYQWFSVLCWSLVLAAKFGKFWEKPFDHFLLQKNHDSRQVSMWKRSSFREE